VLLLTFKESAAGSMANKSPDLKVVNVHLVLMHGLVKLCGRTLWLLQA